MRSKRLAIVLELAERELEAAAQAFEKARRFCLEEEQKLTQLEDYYADYQQAFASGGSMRVQDLMKQRNFLEQLAQAKRQQQGAIRTAQLNLEGKRQAWQKCHLKHKNMAELISRYRAEEDAVMAKKEQKMLDEWFQQTQGQRTNR